MEYLAVCLTIVIALLDSLIFMQPIQNLPVALFIHLVLSLVIYLLCKRYLKKNKDLPLCLVLFMPGLGGVLISALHFSLLYFEKNTMVLDEYERYINYEISMSRQESFNYEQEISTMSFLDYMNLLDVTSKKNLIIDLSINQTNMKVTILQKGLQDKDSEVQHYAAATINMIENEYTQMINRVREEYNLHKDLDSLVRLRSVYKKYLESGSLSGEVFQVFNQDYIEVLEKLIERKRESPEILHDMVNAYISLGDLEKANVFNAKLLQYTERPEGLKNNMRIAYEKYNFHDIVKMSKEKQNIDPEDKQDKKIFWVQKGEL